MIINGVTSTIGGIPVSQLNGTKIITVANANAYTYTVATAATSDETGGTGAYAFTSSIVYWDVTDSDGPMVSLSELGSAYAKSYRPYVA